MSKSSGDRRNYFSNSILFVLLASLGLNLFLIYKNSRSVFQTARISFQTKVTKVIDGDTFDI
ncbi:hypothetical protein A2767_04950 [Candidatus Roizmanbacteria bacterium RIFCSPHIGHO2_01_FULL_35_10]|uniref:Uncharacterized protein n=1 Tax=Candidatus Roizmanbacteria bacterium RIFCSPLOWO2_01_FULL_35_13 TaxID=1802055 RepID=A0A1F7I777_9BACT|nr:MAG: hypothetical protein A2767_04950 [Candidatus Roizmanbacteria bacterium RIFCSPHIGHO2_01_FULL_35_10]OGK39215.1 MAG: hypothetical protein A3A74_07695 [Candidatus Roizmanbacteria bacterium RIFCSPLOWO2_01_FULL_35_13]